MTALKPVFPAPDHDHVRCTADALTHAEGVCRTRRQNLTPIRREVFQALLATHRPLGAYEIIESLARKATRPAPITVYRALDFLMENGLVHRIESRNAFIACAQDHGEASVIAFLICEACGSVGELPASSLTRDFHQAAHRAGFTPRLSVVEITGICAYCQGAT